MIGAYWLLLLLLVAFLLGYIFHWWRLGRPASWDDSEGWQRRLNLGKNRSDERITKLKAKASEQQAKVMKLIDSHWLGRR